MIDKIRRYTRTKLNHYKIGLDYYLYKKDFDKLKSVYPSYSSLKIHYGCGPRVLKGWINIDQRFESADKYIKHYGDNYSPEVRGSKDDFFAIDIFRTGLPFPDNSVDVVFHEDFIEHLDQEQQIIFLAEIFRVIKPGASHRVNTPDLIASMKEHSNFDMGADGVYKREWSGSGHKNILTANYLAEIASMVGYRQVLFNSKNNSVSKEMPFEYRPGIDRKENGNIFADLIK